MKRDITEYLDYRDYIFDLYNRYREEKSYFSYRYMQSKTGTDASHIAKIFSKKRHLPERAIASFVQLFDLNKRDEECFRLLINFNKAKTDKEAKLFYEQLISYQDINSSKLNKNQYEYFNKWYYTAILVLLDFYRFKDNYKELANILTPSITVTEAKNSIKLLENLNLIKKDRDGYYIPTNKFVTTGETVRELAIKNYQEEVIKMAYESLHRHDKKDRDISTVTITINKDDIPAIREIIRKFRQSLLHLSNETPEPNSVYQLNVQLYPMTQEVVNE